MKTISVYCSVLIFILTGCEKEYPWNFSSEKTSRIVVDGIITNEPIPQCIRLSRTNPDLNQDWNPVSGAIVNVKDGTYRYNFIESDSDSGYYYSEAFQAVMDREYLLTIILGTDTFNAEAEATPVAALPDLTTDFSKDENMFRFIYYGESNPAMTEVFYDWSSVPEYCEEYGNCYAQETYYSLNNVDVNDLFSPDREIIYFPSGTVIIRKKYSLSDAHQRYLRSLLMETEWSGGLFDVQHGNAETNLTNEALGFFAVCMAVSDTTVLE